MIEADELTRRFGGSIAVDRLSLRVPPGTILALLGPNGAGKTTTVRMLAGLLAPTDGRATVAGRDVRRDPAGVRARVGLVTDAPGLYEQMTPPAYLDFFGGLYGLDAATRRRHGDELLGFFDLTAHRRERMAGFSKGDEAESRARPRAAAPTGRPLPRRADLGPGPARGAGGTRPDRRAEGRQPHHRPLHA